VRADENERFIDAYRRLGSTPFLDALYGANNEVPDHAA